MAFPSDNRHPVAAIKRIKYLIAFIAGLNLLAHRDHRKANFEETDHNEDRDCAQTSLVPERLSMFEWQ